jgi:hypothetical protein
LSGDSAVSISNFNSSGKSMESPNVLFFQIFSVILK